MRIADIDEERGTTDPATALADERRRGLGCEAKAALSHPDTGVRPAKVDAR